MRRLVLALGAAVLAGCSSEAPPADPPAPPTLNAADLAGTWTFQTRGETSDSVLVTYTVTATGTADGWMITLPGRDPMPMVVTIAGDSIMTRTGPYESVLRQGVQVTTDGVLRLMDGKLVGTSNAHYASAGADSLVRLRMEGTRNP
jgi:hypothetical protein